MQEALRGAAAEFLSRESNRQSLITVTATEVSENGQRGRIYFTVLPTEAEVAVLKFVNRNRKEFGAFFQKRVRGMPIPHVEFVIDKGEKLRQCLDELS